VSQHYETISGLTQRASRVMAYVGWWQSLCIPSYPRATSTDPWSVVCWLRPASCCVHRQRIWDQSTG